ncbi:MAG: hypothetical protein J1D88_06405 [Treponema sp.]|nr:hypothetical protein [Treponema sp.]
MSVSRFVRMALGCALLCAAAAVPSVPAAAESSGKRDTFLDDFESRAWASGEGLPGNMLTDVIQDSLGYLYIGTYEGLVRFDGVEFVTLNSTYDPAFSFMSVRSLHHDSGRNIWVGTNDEGLVRISPAGEVAVFTMDDGLPSNSVRAISEDLSGNVWVGTSSGVACITQAGSILRPDGLESYDDEQIMVAAMYCDTAGRIWISSAKPNSLYYYTENRFVRYSGISSVSNPVVTAIAQDSRGAFWFGVSPHLAVRVESGSEKLYDIGSGKQPGTSVQSIYPDTNGNIWFALDSDVTILHNGKLYYYYQQKGLLNSNVKRILEDREGNIWFVTDRGGLEKLSLAKFKTQTLPTAVNAITEDEERGVFWLGTDSGLLCYDENLNPVENSITRACANVRIRHVGLTAGGDLLVGTYDRLGQLRFNRNGSVQGWNAENGLAVDRVRVAMEAGNGDLYIGTTMGLDIVDHETGVLKHLNRESGLPHDYIMCMYEDSAGTLWFGTDGGGVFTLKDGELDRGYTTEDGLAGNVIFKIEELRPGEIWICTGTGISRFKDNSFFTFNAANGLGTGSVFQMLLDYTGHVWMTSNRGISSVLLSSLEDVANGISEKATARFFSRSDGIRSGGVTSTSVSMKDRLGRIWFTLIDGFAIYDPVKVASNKSVPVIHVQKITVDNEVRACNGETIVLPPEAKRLNIKYTGLSFVSSDQILFSYKLAGFDSEYSEWTLDRSVSYTNLKPGNYRFTVRAENSDDVASPLSDALVIKKLPYFWQLWYFWFAVILMVLATAALVVRNRFRRLSMYKVRLEREVVRQTEELHRKNGMLEDYVLELRTKTEELQKEKERSENLLLNILPPSVAKELSENPDKVIANQCDNASVLFADIAGFTSLSSYLRANDIVRLLNDLFCRFDSLVKDDSVEKIKTIGDCYMAACGLFSGDSCTCARRMVSFAMQMFEKLREFNRESPIKLQMRVGINTGMLIAGVIGKTKFIYDIWGDTVNVASRMESTGVPGKIHVTEATYALTKGQFSYGNSVDVEVKGKGTMKTYFMDGLTSAS